MGGEREKNKTHRLGEKERENGDERASNVTERESETLPAPLLILIWCQTQPSAPTAPCQYLFSLPVIKTGGAQLSLWSRPADKAVW